MWSEIWALLIPLTIIIFFKPKEPAIRPIIYYVIIAFILNLLATIITFYIEFMPPFIKGNNFIYNIHSVAKVFFFGWYIHNLKLVKPSWIPWLILTIYILIAAIFILFQPYNLLSSFLFAAESIALLILCILIFINSMLDDSKTNWLWHTSFLVTVGIVQFEIINFFTFPFLQFFAKDQSFGLLTLQIFSVAYIILCIVLAITLYRSRKEEFTD